jgi:N4-gp56 family major capsid protein
MSTLNTTVTANLTNAQRAKWEKKLRLDMYRDSFFSDFQGAQGARMPLIVRDDFTSKIDAGTTVHIQTLARLGSAGVTAESSLQGNEEKLRVGQFDMTADWVRNGVSFTKKATKNTIFDCLMTANSALSDWGATYVDAAIFAQLLDNTSYTLYANNARSSAELGTDDIFGATEIDRIRLNLIRQNAIPLRVTTKGKMKVPIYGLVTSEIDEWNLEGDTTYTDTVKEAYSGSGDANPLLYGAAGIYHNMLIYHHYGIGGYQGSPLRPEASVYGVHSNVATTITVGLSTDKIDYTKFFPSAGTLAITNSSNEKEYVDYTGKTVYSFTGCTRGATYGPDGASNGASAYTGNELVTSYNHRSRVVGFGAEAAAIVWGQYPEMRNQAYDYDFENGVAIEMMFGVKAIENYAGNKQNYCVMECYSGNPNISL